MTTYQVVVAPETSRWDAFVTTHPDAHTLQTADWGQLKSAFGWSAQSVAVEDAEKHLVAGAQILFRRLPLRLGTMGYIPAGPLFCSDDPQHAANKLLWQGIDQTARQHGAAFIKVEPCNWYRARPELPAALQAAGLRPSPQTVQPPRTMVLDLRDGEEAVLKRMNQSTRRKVKLGPRNEVEVRQASATDLSSFTGLMQTTGERNAFGVHDPAYYEMAHKLFSSGERCALWLALMRAKTWQA